MENIDGVTVVDVTTGPAPKVKLTSPDNSLGVKVALGAVEIVSVVMGVARVVMGVACVVVVIACVVVWIMLKEVPSPVTDNDLCCVCVETLVSPSVLGEGRGEGLEVELSMVVEGWSEVLLNCDEVEEVEDIDGEGISRGRLGLGSSRPPEDVVVALLISGVDDIGTALEVRVGLLTRDEDDVEGLGADVIVESFREAISRTSARRLVPRGSEGRRTMPAVSLVVHDMSEHHVLAD